MPPHPPTVSELSACFHPKTTSFGLHPLGHRSLTAAQGSSLIPFLGSCACQRALPYMEVKSVFLLLLPSAPALSPSSWVCSKSARPLLAPTLTWPLGGCKRAQGLIAQSTRPHLALGTKCGVGLHPSNATKWDFQIKHPDQHREAGVSYLPQRRKLGSLPGPGGNEESQTD